MWKDRVNILTLWTAPGAMLVIASVGMAAPGVGPCYTADWDDRVTITGTVANPEISARCPRGVAQRYAVVETLADDGQIESWRVLLGPDDAAPVDSLDLREGEVVTVSGARLANETETVLVAASIERDGEVIDLRGPTGRPGWRGACGRTMPGNDWPCMGPRRGWGGGSPDVIELP